MLRNSVCIITDENIANSLNKKIAVRRVNLFIQNIRIYGTFPFSRSLTHNKNKLYGWHLKTCFRNVLPMLEIFSFNAYLHVNRHTFSKMMKIT